MLPARPGVDQCLRLGLQRFDQGAGAVPEAVYAQALSEIQVSTAGVIPQPGTLATHEHAFGALAQLQAMGTGSVRVEGRLIGEGGSEAEQVHGRHRLQACLALPMYFASIRTRLMFLIGSCGLLFRARLGAWLAVSHFDLASFSISRTYGFSTAALLCRSL